MRGAYSCSSIFVVLFLVIAGSGARLPASDDTRLVEIIAESDNRFHVIGEKTPVIHARPGERLRLRITAHKGQEIARDGAVHSLVVRKLREQGWDLRLYEGTQEFTVNAPASSGEFLAECTVKCGPGHDDMRLKLLVKQQ